MKASLFTFFLFLVIGAEAQLSNTSWKGIFYVPDPVECQLVFSSDTATLSFSGSQVPLEMMSFRMSGDTIFFKKITGMSTCYDEKEAAYQYKREGTKLYFTVVDDPCYDRRNAFPAEALEIIESGKL